MTRGSWPARAANLFGAATKGRPDSAAISAAMASAKALRRVEPGAHRGAALGQLVDRRQRRADGALGVVELGDEGREFLAEGDRRGVHQVGAPGLDQAGVPRRLFGETAGKLGDGRQQLFVHGLGGGDVHGGGEAVVGTLRAVDVVVGMHRRLAAARIAGQFVGAAGDHLVDVHVGLGAAAGLPDHQREVFVVAACEDLVGGLFNQPGDFRRQFAEVVVDPRGGFLDQRQGVDHGERHALAADGEVLQRALGLGAPVGVVGHLDGAQAIGFGPAHECSPGCVSGSLGLRSRLGFRCRRFLVGIFRRAAGRK